MAPSPIASITGAQFPANDPDYPAANACYSLSSEQDAHDMHPGLIIQPASAKDIALVLRHARSQHPPTPIAIRTGGHQYGGASSTGPGGILLDLKTTFAGEAELLPVGAEPGELTQVRTSVSWKLEDFHAFLAERGCFVPHGQCFWVGLGGHVQTGGYGQLGRSFGLLGDYVTEIELVDADLTEADNFTKRVSKDVDPDLFHAILGGSPGNLGVLTHFTIDVQRDADYMGCRGVRTLWYYEQGRFQYLMEQLVALSDEKKKLPQCYDICISVVSKASKGWTFWPGLDDAIRHSQKKQNNKIPAGSSTDFPLPVIALFMQYCPVPGSPAFDPAVFARFTKVWNAGTQHISELPDFALHSESHGPDDDDGDSLPMSQLTAKWLMPTQREFPFPYIKRTYLTAWTASRLHAWPARLAAQVQKVIDSKGCYTVSQVQYFGGAESAFYKNRGNGTSFSWRDSSFVCTVDCFYNVDDDTDALGFAKRWQAENDLMMNGAGTSGTGEEDGKTAVGGVYSDEDRRVLWGSYSKEGESWDLDETADFYFEPANKRDKYRRLQQVRARVDPDGVLTPNVFCVRRAGVAGD